MGRGFIVEDVVEGYLSRLCEQSTSPITGLLIGQNSAQRDFVVMATQTPQRQESGRGFVDKEWVCEHGRQVSRMLPGGLSVLGVFIITDSSTIDILAPLQLTVCELDKTISSEYLWVPTDDDVIEYVILHVNPKDTTTTCRTFNIKDPKSPLKSADWKYQSSVCSAWSMITCCLNVDILLPLSGSRAGIENMDPCLKEGLKVWAHQIQEGFCLFDCKRIPEDMELTSGQKRNVRQTVNGQLLIPLENQRLTNLVQQCGGSMSIRGAIHSRVFLLGSKTKSKFAEKLLKRDVVSTLATRVSIILDELLTSDVDCKGTGKDKKAGNQQEGPSPQAWSRSRFLPIEGEFFLATVACWGSGPWDSVKCLETLYK
ncbi:protein odr-4 homolog isoform X3 [Takifugu flavidus]|uniref:protein odr-4 homolog isoform X3 n=1 Tax=Takifugu flavidus TaxID=433684 RepID=UPI00254439DD|nr:protein odr-4 homolog isoform X3 [Takifugu flavidus]